MGQFAADPNSVFEEALHARRATIAERMHPPKPIRIEVSEISWKYFKEKRPHEHRG